MHTSAGFTGQHEDVQAPGSSGLDYFNARYYDPLIGRFTSADDVVGSDPLLDGYAYVGGMVESATDPSGHDPIPWWLPLLPTPLQAGVVVGGAAVGLTVWVFSGNADQDLAWDRTDVVYPYGYVQPAGPDIRLGPYGNPYRGVIVDQPPPDFGPTGKPLPRRRTPPAAPVGKPGGKPGPVPAPGGGGRQPPRVPPVAGPAHPDENGCGCGGNGPVNVYRVQGGKSKIRLHVTEDGNLSISGRDALWLNFGQWGRALAYLARRGPGAYIVQFQVQQEFLDFLRSVAVPESLASQFPDSPVIGDPAIPDQYAIRSNLFNELLEYTIPGSAQIIEEC